MMEYWAVYQVASGDFLWAGASSVAGSAAAQEPGDGLAAAQVPLAAVVMPGALAIEPVRAAYRASVDTGAGLVRAQFITTVPGQAETYLYKANEARAYKTDASASVPFLTAEAAARSMTVAALADEVLANEAAWMAIGSKIEAARMGAKAAIDAATNIGGVVRAATVNWTAVTMVAS